MSDVFSSLFLVLVVSVAPFLIFLTVVTWQKSPAGADLPDPPAIDAEATWRKAVAGLVYSAISLLVLSVLIWLTWARFGASYPGAFPAVAIPVMYFAIALFNLLMAANQIKLGWPRAQNTWWARHALRRYLPPEIKTNQSPNQFGENGAVLK